MTVMVRRVTSGFVCALLLWAFVGCAEEEATPVDPANPPVLDSDDTASPDDPVIAEDMVAELEAELEKEIGDVTHFFEPSQQMRDAATQQCFDDPELAEGYIKAVDPNNPEVVVSEITVDCATARNASQ